MESALIGVLLGGLIATFAQYLTTRLGLDAQRRKNRQDYLASWMDRLAKTLAEYEVWLSKTPGHSTPPDNSELATEHARIIGEAIAACLAVGDLPEKNDIPDLDIQSEKLPDVPYKASTKLHKIHRLAYIANERLTRNFVRKETLGAGGEDEIRRWGDYKNRNRAALDHAVKRLAQLIDETK